MAPVNFTGVAHRFTMEADVVGSAHEGAAEGMAASLRSRGRRSANPVTICHLKSSGITMFSCDGGGGGGGA